MDNNKIIIVRIKKELVQPIGYMRDSYENKLKRYYIVANDEDEDIVTNHSDLQCMVVFVVFEPSADPTRDRVEELFVGTGHITHESIPTVHWRINYTIDAHFTSEMVIANFLSSSELELKKDFEKRSFIRIEENPELVKQLSFLSKPVYDIRETSVWAPVESYPEIESESAFHEFSQKNVHCKKPIGIFGPQENRPEFQRDYDRIIHAKAYRRLVDKAQIFTSSKGDHYRTRMTHTLEVAQIARSIAVGLNLNMVLTEAIALAHDLGHTPFGHQGERTLDRILKGEIDIIKHIPDNENNYFGGFKHNFQGLRVVDCLEEKYAEFDGLDLSYQVMEGILKHTSVRIKDCENCSSKHECKKNCFNINEFLRYGDSEQLYTEYPFATTLEGQIVAIADEIAQRSHDLDDAFESRIIDTEQLNSYLSIQKATELNDAMKKTRKSLDDVKKHYRSFVDEEELVHSRIVSEVIAFFIKDVIQQSRQNMCGFERNEFYEKEHRFDKKLISFSEKGEFLCAYLEKIISKKVINSPEVVRFDNMAATIVEKLFTAYYNNPRLLHKGTLRKIFIEIRRDTNNAIDFIEGDRDEVTKEIKRIVHANLNEMDPEMADEYRKKKKALVRAIADYIAGMTDSYAINEYNSIYK